METASVVKTVNLVKEFNGSRALNQVSLDVKAGEICAIIGPNGAGKSTFFNTVTGEKEVTSGEIFYQGRNITKKSANLRIRMGIGRTFQITSIFPGLSVTENVQIALMAHHRREYNCFSWAKTFFRDEAKELINQVGLYKERLVVARSLSHGDKRMLDLAIALSNKPTLLMLDEPTQGMAPADRIQMMNKVVSIAKEKKLTIVFTEHDMDVVFAHATKLVVMHHGAILAVGKPEEVKENKEVIRVYLGESSH